MTLSIVDFLNARLKADQDAAEAARDLMDEPWKIFPEGPEEENYSGGYRISSGVTIAGHVEEAKAAHIARHDPARVLREVTAKRAIIEMAAYRLTAAEELEAKGVESTGELRAPAEYLLSTLAAIYSNHAEFREEW
jgi:hypothetical protein